MTSRTSPVGVIVFALLGLIVIGCGAPTSAVLQALIASSGAVVSSPAGDQGELPAGQAGVWWQHPDGYAMTLPAGWLGVAVGASQTDDYVDALRDTLPGLADRAASVLAGSKTRISAVAYAPDGPGHVSPVLLVLAEPADGRRPHAIKTDVNRRIAALPGLASSLSPHGVTLPNAKGERYDYTIIDPDLRELRVRSFVFRSFGGTVYLVNCIVSADVVEAAGIDFDAIIDSLRFGV